MTERQRLRLEAAQATLCVLAGTLSALHQQASGLQDDVLGEFDEYLEGEPTDQIASAVVAATRRLGQASSAVDHAFSTACEAVEWHHS